MAAFGHPAATMLVMKPSTRAAWTLAWTLFAASSCGGGSETATTVTLPTTTTEAPTTTTTTTSPTTTTIATTTTESPGCTALELDYFAQVAGAAEFGPQGTIHKWQEDLRIQVHGDPEPALLATLADVVADLDAILEPMSVSVVESGGNVDLHFAPVSQFPVILLEYEPGNLGYVYIWWDGEGVIDRATVLISTTEVEPVFQTHLIREELTQALGLLNDSWDYPDSIFYQGWTSVQEYTPLDVDIIEMLYEPAVIPGMPLADALNAVTCEP